MQDSAGVHRLGEQPMNRIREIREAAGLSSDELGERVGTSGAQIRRLETGERKLTADWMGRIAEVLGCTPADLIANAMAAEIRDEVEIAAIDPVIASSIAKRGLKAYTVTAKSVAGAGINPGDVIMVDESQAAIDHVQTGDIVLVELQTPSAKVLRGIYITQEFSLLLTVRRGANLTISTDDPAVRPAVIGVVIRS